MTVPMIRGRVPSKPCGFRGRGAPWKKKHKVASEFRSRVNSLVARALIAYPILPSSLINRTVSVDVKHRDRRRNTRSVYLSEWTSWASHRVKSVRSCVVVEVAVLGSRPNKPYGFYGRKATLNCTGHSFSLTCQRTSEDMKLYVIIVLHSPPLTLVTVPTVPVDITQHLKEKKQK